MNVTVNLTPPSPLDYQWQLAALNDRLMNRAKYEAAGEQDPALADRV